MKKLIDAIRWSQGWEDFKNFLGGLVLWVILAFIMSRIFGW